MSQPPPFSPYPPQQPAKKSSKKTCLIVLVILLVLAGLCCGGLVGGYFWFSSQISESFRSTFQEHPEMLKHLGPIEEFQWDLMATGEASQLEVNVFVFRVKGEKGSGLLHVKMRAGSADASNILWAELEMDGETFEIIPRAKPLLPNIDPRLVPPELPPLGDVDDDPAP